MNVMIVDDSKYLRLMIRKILKKHGYDIVAEAESGAEAIEKYKEFMPTIVTMDIVMPKMNGLLAIKEILKINPEANIVVVTALGHEPLVRQALKTGAKNFVIKPFQVDQLVQAVEGIL